MMLKTAVQNPCRRYGEAVRPAGRSAGDAPVTLVARKNPDMPAEELKLAGAVGIGAVKYADLSRTVPPTISSTGTCWRLEGNTAPYMQYAYTRVLSAVFP